MKKKVYFLQAVVYFVLGFYLINSYFNFLDLSFVLGYETFVYFIIGVLLFFEGFKYLFGKVLKRKVSE